MAVKCGIITLAQENQKMLESYFISMMVNIFINII